MIDPATATIQLPAPLTQPEIDNKIHNAKIKLTQSKILIAVLIFGAVYNIIFAIISPEHQGFHNALIRVYAAICFISCISIYSDMDVTGAKSILNDHQPILSPYYKPLLELRNKHKPIDDYINAVNIEGREIVNLELNLFNYFEKQYLKNKEISNTEHAKAALYSN